MSSKMLFELNELRFELCTDWLSLPHRLPVMPVAGVACADDGCLYALTRNHEHPILAFDPRGKYMCTLGADLDFGNEHGISIASDGNLWVCDSGRHVVYKLTRHGEVMMRLGEMDKPCDNGFDPLMPYPHNLYTVTRAGEPFNQPTGAAEARDGTIWCTDGYGNASLHHFSKEGRLLRTVGGPGRGPGQFRLPHALWIDSEGRIWVADRDNFRVELFDEVGDLIRCFEPVLPHNSPYGPSTIWGDGQYIFCCQDSRGIIVYDEITLDLVGLIETCDGSPLLSHSICGDAYGNLYIGNLHPEPMVIRLVRIL